jgi:flagellar basal-body rod protein FlgC
MLYIAPAGGTFCRWEKGDSVLLEAISARDIAVSGLKAQRTRMNVIANNIANAMTTVTPGGGTFRRQIALLSGHQLGGPGRPDKFGVEVMRVAKDMSPLKQVYEPDNPHADTRGFVEYPNVNLSVEMVNLVSAQRAYEANIATITAGRTMSARAMRIIGA